MSEDGPLGEGVDRGPHRPHPGSAVSSGPTRSRPGGELRRVNRLASIFNIRPGEGERAAFVAALFAALQAGQGLGANAADALFLLRFGADFLPYFYMVLGGLTFVLSLGYSTAVSRPRKGRFFTLLLLVAAGLVVAARLSITLGHPSVYPAIWLAVNAIGALLGTLVWNVAGEVCDTRQAKRLFSLFASAGILGGVVGNALTGFLAESVGTENLLVAFAGLLLIGALLASQGARRFFPPPSTRPGTSRVWEDLTAGFRFVRRSPLMILVSVASVLFSVLFFSVSFPFSRLVSTSFPNEAQVAGFLGTFSSVTTGVTFLLSLFVANRLYARLGIVNTVLIAPFVYLAGFGLWVLQFGLAEAVAVRFLQLTVLGGLAGGAWSALFNVVPAERRAQVTAFQAGVPTQAGVVLSGALLILGEQTLTASQIFTLGIVTALICGGLVWRMRRSYGEALVAALRAGILDVFTATARGFQHLGGDAEGLQAALQALGDPKPEVRRTAAEILGQLGRGEAIGDLLRATEDAAVEVRAEAVRALGRLGAAESLEGVRLRLADAAPEVRRAAVDAYASVAPHPADALRALARDADPTTRARVAVALAGTGEGAEAGRALSMLLEDARPAARFEGLRACREARICDPGRVLLFLKDDDPRIRLEAVRCLVPHVRAEDVGLAVAAMLEDPAPQVREEAAAALRGHAGGPAHALSVLESGTENGQLAALAALRGSGAVARGPVRAWALVKIDEASRLRSWEAGLAEADGPDESLEVMFLGNRIRRLRERREMEILRALEALGSGEALTLVGAGMRSQDQALRAQAIEALETLGDPDLARAFTRMLEGGVDAKGRPGKSRALDGLSRERDPWLRAVALRALAERARRDLESVRDRVRTDSDPIVRLAAPDSLEEEGKMGETLRTLSTMERVLFLGRVPIFANLAPEDLQEISQVATERVFSEGDALCTEGEDDDDLFILVEGHVRVTKKANGTSRTLGVRGAGEPIGEMAILRRQPRSATVTAEAGSVRALVITGRAFESILLDRPQVALATLSCLAERLSGFV